MDDLQPVRLHKNISQLLRLINDPNDLLSRTGYTILAVIIGVFSVAGIFLNVLVVVVTISHRQLRQPLNFALVNLAIADLGCAIFGGVPTMVTNAMGYFSLGRLGCVLEGFAVAFFGELKFYILTDCLSDLVIASNWDFIKVVFTNNLIYYLPS